MWLKCEIHTRKIDIECDAVKLDIKAPSVATLLLDSEPGEPCLVQSTVETLAVDSQYPSLWFIRSRELISFNL